MRDPWEEGPWAAHVVRSGAATKALGPSAPPGWGWGSISVHIVAAQVWCRGLETVPCIFCALRKMHHLKVCLSQREDEPRERIVGLQKGCDAGQGNEPRGTLQRGFLDEGCHGHMPKGKEGQEEI